MGICVALFGILTYLPAFLSQEASETTLIINGTTPIATTDANYVCATIDWWPHDKCNYNNCPWGYSSVINMDLSHPFLANAIQAFEHLRIRIGGSLQDQVLYDVGSVKAQCHPFQKMEEGLFGFSKGCLHMSRWDELNKFFSKTGAIVTFGLNALHGRHKIRKGVWGGSWDSSNAHEFIQYTVSKGYAIDSWEFGNELSGSGVGASVDANQYGKDLINLKGILNNLYSKFRSKPLLLAPGGFYEEPWYSQLLRVSGPNVVNVMTHHIYNLGAGDDPNLVRRILDPHHLSKESKTFSSLERTIKTHGPWASAWVGESGGAYNSGGHLVSDTFVNSFWYLDQLGMAAKYNTKVYCRQTLIGGNYGLLNTSTFVPNPDYYSALLWHKLMGEIVLAVGSDASPYLRSYAHCTKGRAGLTLLLINLSNSTNFILNVRNSMTINMNTDDKSLHKGSSFMNGLKRTVSWVGSTASDRPLTREEYHLTPKDGHLRSQTMFLNGRPLELTGKGEILNLQPLHVKVNSPLSVAPLSIAFIVFSNFDAPACG